MIYLVSNQQQLFETDEYSKISLDDAIDLLSPHRLIEFDSETAGLDPYTKPLLCTQYGIPNTQIVVDNTTITIEQVFSYKSKSYLDFLYFFVMLDIKLDQFLYFFVIVLNIFVNP